ncbi:MAG: response regulator [Rhodospirillales bacterium]|nr:response regulator [Rhodospirillales bacterium]
MKTLSDVVAGTVFVVEDDVGVRDSLLALLHAAGWRTTAFGTGGEVLKYSGTLGQGCLLLDICLPDYDGFEVLMSLRRAGVCLPVIFMTAEERSAEQARAPEIGALAVLQKPLNEAHLLSAIGRAMEPEPPVTRKQQFYSQDLSPFGFRNTAATGAGRVADE